MKKKHGEGRGGWMQDAAEKWLRENDPDYSRTKRMWQVPSTDALERPQGRDPMYSEMHPLGNPMHGNFWTPPKPTDSDTQERHGTGEYGPPVDEYPDSSFFMTEEDFIDEGGDPENPYADEL